MLSGAVDADQTTRRSVVLTAERGIASCEVGFIFKRRSISMLPNCPSAPVKGDPLSLCRVQSAIQVKAVKAPISAPSGLNEPYGPQPRSAGRNRRPSS